MYWKLPPSYLKIALLLLDLTVWFYAATKIAALLV